MSPRAALSPRAAGTALVLFVAAAASCSTAYSEEPRASGDGGASVDGGSGGADASAPSDGGSVGEAGVAPCAEGAPPANAVYVSATATGSTPDGTAARPFATITAARNAARITPGAVAMIAVDHGTYPEALVLEGFAKETFVDGGWAWDGASTWTRDCSPNAKGRTILRSPDDVGVLVRNNTAPVELTRLTVETRGPSVATPRTAGASRYGVFVDRALVRLTGVTVRARDGNPGGAAAAGAPGGTRCASALGAACTGGLAGGERAPVAPPITFGQLTAAGYVAATVAPGAPGGEGANGAPGGPGSSRSDCFNGCAAQPSCENANPGKTETSSTGECGCGGTGGAAGENGFGGGGSFAVYAVGATSLVVVSYSDLLAEGGGAGSPGGVGGVGGVGTQGKVGAAPTCYPTVCCRLGVCPNCGCYPATNWNPVCAAPPPSPLPLPGGAAGGAGQPGGRGANGAGGPGGPSFTVVRVDGAQVSIVDSALSFGAGGAGASGAPGGPSGPEPP